MNKLVSLTLALGVSALGFVAPAQAVTAASFIAGANLSGVQVQDLNLKGKNLKGINLTNATLTRVDLSNVNFTKAKLQGVTFVDSTLNGAKFIQANLNGAIFRNATMKAASIQFVDATGVRAIDCVCTSLFVRSSSLTAANFSGSNLQRAVMNGNEFVQTNFSGADLSSVNSSRDSFVGKSNFESTTLSGAIFDKATFKDANFSNAKFGKSKFPNNQWISIKLKGAKLQEASLRGVKSSRLSGGPALPSNVKLLGGVLQMAPAAPVFVKYAKSGTRHVMTWSEVLQTGVSATMRYRISTDKVRWSAWTEAKGARTEDPFRFRTQVRFTLRKVQPGTEYFVQAYWFNAMGKSKTRIARIQVI